VAHNTTVFGTQLGPKQGSGVCVKLFCYSLTAWTCLKRAFIKCLSAAVLR
jgi:hypothetical protein